MKPLHATAIALALDEDGPLAGILLLGPEGSGKSSLALAAIESCAHRRTALVADDAVLIEARNGALIARTPKPIAGLIEVFGFGPVGAKSVAEIRLLAALDLGAALSRLPDPGEFGIDDAAIPLYPFVGGPERLRAIVRAIVGGRPL